MPTTPSDRHLRRVEKIEDPSFLIGDNGLRELLSSTSRVLGYAELRLALYGSCRTEATKAVGQR